MVLALDRHDAVEEIVEVVAQSLLISSTPVPRKLARLNIISDILHNCAGTATNAWKYRIMFEARLPDIFSHLGEIYKSFPGRMKAETFRKQVMAVHQVWENWLVFTPTVLADLEKRLSRRDEQEEGKAAEAQMASAPIVPEDDQGGSTGRFTGFSAVKAGVTDAPVSTPAEQDEDLDGEALPATEGGDDDLDGEAIDGEDLDGAELDGAPM